MSPSRRYGLAITILLVAAVSCGRGGDAPAAEDATTPADGGAAEPAGDDDLPPEVAAAAASAAEAGLGFVTSREELEALAAEEDGLHVVWGLGSEEEIYELVRPFEERYPHLEGKVTIDHLDGVESRERFLLEVAADAVDDIGVLYAATEVYDEMSALCDWDIYGMAEAGILDIPLEMIDHNKRTVIGAGSTPGIFVYNLEAFEDVPLPETWDDLLDPEIYGPDGPIDIVGDVRLATYSAIVPAWGLERATEFYGTFAEDIEPVWTSRFAPYITQIDNGEFDAFPFVNLPVTSRLLTGGPEYLSWPDAMTGTNMGIHIIEPVPVRISETHCVVAGDMNPSPYSSILFMEWLVSEDGQAAYENPGGARYQSSVHTRVPNGVGELLDGLELSIVDWDHFNQQSDYIEAIISAAGFPEPAD